MHEGVYQGDIEGAFDFGRWIEYGEPVRAFFFEVGRDGVDVDFVGEGGERAASGCDVG